MTNETELDQLNQYQKVCDCEKKAGYRMEQGKKWRQFLAAVLCKSLSKFRERNFG
jgi:hypothetical protein